MIALQKELGQVKQDLEDAEGVWMLVMEELEQAEADLADDD